MTNTAIGLFETSGRIVDALRPARKQTLHVLLWTGSNERSVSLSLKTKPTRLNDTASASGSPVSSSLVSLPFRIVVCEFVVHRSICIRFGCHDLIVCEFFVCEFFVCSSFVSSSFVSSSFVSSLLVSSSFVSSSFVSSLLRVRRL